MCEAVYDLSRNSSVLALVLTYGPARSQGHNTDTHTQHTHTHALSGGYGGYVGVGNENMSASRFTGESNLTSGPREIYL